MSTPSPNMQTVKILGVEYTLRGQANPERMIDLARYVDGKLRTVKSRSKEPHDTTKLAILTSLNIAFELHGARQASATRFEEVRRRAGELADQLDRCLAEERATT